MQLNFDKLGARADVEAIINEMDYDDTLTHVNIGRRRQLDDKNFKPDEEEIRAGILLVRRLRSLRETKKTKKAAPKKSEGFASLADML